MHFNYEKLNRTHTNIPHTLTRNQVFQNVDYSVVISWTFCLYLRWIWL